MKDSLVYLSILDYVKKNGIGNFRELFNQLENITSDIVDVEEYLFGSEETKTLDGIVKRNINLIKFLRKLCNDNIYFLNDNFKEFILNLESNDKIDLYIENAKKLFLLGVDRICINSKNMNSARTELYLDDSKNLNAYKNKDNHFIYFESGKIIFNRSIYTDGKITINDVPEFTGKGLLTHPIKLANRLNHEQYLLRVKDANFILGKENHSDMSKYRYLYLKGVDFDFDISKLPSKLELESYNEPEYVKQYKKTFKLR